MRTVCAALLTAVAFTILAGSGCTKIDTPLRPSSGNGPAAPLVIQAETGRILDTQPLVLEAEEGDKTVVWSTDPAGFGLFQPEAGQRVVFMPPDVGEDCTVLINARSEDGRQASLSLSVIDQGGPPLQGEVVLNEIGWAGTLTSSMDEYIEIASRSDRELYLNDWLIENAGGGGNPLLFSGHLQPGGFLVIANYAPDSGKSGLACTVDVADSDLSLSNSTFGPYVLTDISGAVYDQVGDGGGSYPCGVNQPDCRGSMARYTDSLSTAWQPADWYTESVTAGISDGTWGTPGGVNSDQPPGGGGPGGDDALLLITEYAVDADDDLGDDWVRLFTLQGGAVERISLTDLDGDDGPLTSGQKLEVEAGDELLVIWSDAYEQTVIDGDRIYTDMPNPTGTKDQLVLLCAGAFMDGVCYCSDPDDPFDGDDGAVMQGYGWSGPPVHGKRAVRKTGSEGEYLLELNAPAWEPVGD